MEIPLRNQQAAAVAVAVETARRGSLQAALQYTWMGFADTVKSTEEDEGLDMDEGLMAALGRAWIVRSLP